VFADTGWEPVAVYRHLWGLAERCAAAGLPLYIASAGDLRADTLDPSSRYDAMPLFIRTATGTGRGRRQCTREYKIEPIGKVIRRRILGLPPGRAPRGVIVEQWFGISLDEAQRMSDPRVSYMRHRYPLIDRGMTRRDCLSWLATHGYDRPPKSSCLGCPFHDDRYWRQLRDGSPDEWADTVAFDIALRAHTTERRGRITGAPYLHRSLTPLGELDLRTVAERGQESLFDVDEYDGECDTGYCHV
jgi:hypothetical protein